MFLSLNAIKLKERKKAVLCVIKARKTAKTCTYLTHQCWRKDIQTSVSVFTKMVYYCATRSIPYQAIFVKCNTVYFIFCIFRWGGLFPGTTRCMMRTWQRTLVNISKTEYLPVTSIAEFVLFRSIYVFLIFPISIFELSSFKLIVFLYVCQRIRTSCTDLIIIIIIIIIIAVRYISLHNLWRPSGIFGLLLWMKVAEEITLH